MTSRKSVNNNVLVSRVQTSPPGAPLQARPSVNVGVPVPPMDSRAGQPPRGSSVVSAPARQPHRPVPQPQRDNKDTATTDEEGERKATRGVTLNHCRCGLQQPRQPSRRLHHELDVIARRTYITTTTRRTKHPSDVKRIFPRTPPRG